MTKDSKPIYEDIRNKIVSLEYAPGTQLREVDLSEQYKVSRTPMRDVLKKLEEEDLIEVRSQRGTYVTRIDLKKLKDLMFIRYSTEFALMSELQKTLTEGQINILEGKLDRLRDILHQCAGNEQEAANLYFEKDNELHQAIYGMVGRESVLDLLNDSFPYYARYRVLTGFTDENHLAKAIATHEALIAALESKDETALKNAVHYHNYSGLEGIEDTKLHHPDYFVED